MADVSSDAGASPNNADSANNHGRTASRLRAACNECHASKVKCSGERTGCLRCAQSGARCIFEVSMVGRCSKGRRRRLINNAKHVANREQRSPSLRLPTPAPSSDDGPERVDADSTTNGSNIITQNGTAVQTPAGGTLANDLIFFDPISLTSPPSLGAWQLDEDVNAGNLSCNNTVNFEDLEHYLGFTRNASVVPDTSNSDGSLLPMNNDNLSMMNLFCDSPTAAAPIDLQPTLKAVDQGSSSTGAADDPFHALHIIFQHIILLETQLREAKRPVDESMHAAKKCIQQLRGVIELESYERCNVCPSMMLAAADLVILLYENIVPRLAPGGETTLQASLAQDASPGGQGSADFRLGKFEADPEDAANVWRYLARGELKRMTGLVEAITSRPQGRDRRQANPKMTASYRSLSAALLQRISSLSDRVNEHL